MNFKEWLRTNEAVSYSPYNISKFLDQNEKALKIIEEKYKNFDYEEFLKEINYMHKEYCMSHERNILHSIEIVNKRMRTMFEQPAFNYSDGADAFGHKGLSFFTYLEKDKAELLEAIKVVEDELIEFKESLPTANSCGEEYMEIYNKFMKKYNNIKNDIIKYDNLSSKLVDFLKHKTQLVNLYRKTGTAERANARENMPQHEDYEIMYHATPMMKEILNNGFKTRNELEGLEVVGGGPSDVVSFTANPQMAIKIANRIKTIIKVAKGIVTFDQIYEWGKNKKIFDESTLEKSKFYAGNGQDIEQALWLYKYYLMKLENAKIGFDPLFFGVKKENLQKLDVNNVGVIQATIDMSKVTEYLPVMEEYRVPKNGISKIKKYQ
jgi:hypothetical protein